MHAVQIMLQQHPDLRIRIEGHSDNTGSMDTSQRLSEQRSQAARNHLVQQGVKGSRVETAGFGQSDFMPPFRPMRSSLIWIVGIVGLIATLGNASGPSSAVRLDVASSALSVQRSAVPLDTIPANPEAVGFEPLQVHDDLSDLLDALRPTEPIAYVEWRLVMLFRDREYPGEHQVTASAGVRCSDQPCKGALDSLVAERGVLSVCAPLACMHYLAVVRGDSAFAVTSTAEAIQWLGRTDAAAEAVLLVMFEGLHPTHIRTEPAGGYMALADQQVSDCPIEHQTHLIRIHEDGRLITEAHGPVRRSGGCF